MLETTNISAKDVKYVVKHFSNRKTPGEDGIPHELLKYGGSTIRKAYSSLSKNI